MVTVVFWVVFGGLAGWVGAMIEEDLDLKQTLAYIALGVTGALAGGVVINLLDNTHTVQSGINSLVFPVFGAILALIIATKTRKLS